MEGVKIKFDGTYLITGQIFWTLTASPTYNYQGSIYVNGVMVLTQGCMATAPATPATWTSNILASVFKLSVGDLVTLGGYAYNGATILGNYTGTDASLTNLAIERLS